MSLKVWLPLTGSLENKGCGNYPLIMHRGSLTYHNEGKIGKCFYANGVNTIQIQNIIPDLYNSNGYSLCVWFYIESNNTTHSGSGIISGGNWNSQLLNLALSDWSTDHYTRLRISGTNWNRTYTYNFVLNKWYHVVVCSDENKTYAYVNGNLIGNTADSFLPTNIEGNHIDIGGATYYAGMQFFGRINDIRIYDHCLSPLEIKQISQGLILHYKLNNNFNLIKNGYGQSGSENWGTVANISSDIPTGNSCIKQSFYNNTTQEYIPLISSHEYKLEVYIKNTSTSGFTYPSLYPYDVDKKFIAVYNCPEGFNLSTMTTLTKELKKGDTKIEVADLSKWNANSGHYYNYAALFGYQDSTGFLYPNGTYTQNTPAFGSSTNAKTNLDKTNNIITLNSSYNGPTMAVGTSICASTAGSVYYYPFGSIAKSSINNWTYKTVNFIPQNVNRLRYAKYIRYSTYDGTLHAGIKLIDLFYDLNKIQDSSGYNHNGQFYSYDTQGGFISVSDTPRYDTSIYIDSANNTTNAASGTVYIYGHCSLTNPTQMTIAFWCKPIAGYGGGTSQGQFCTTNIVFDSNAGSDYQASAMNHRDGAVDINDSASSAQCRLTINFIANEWHHYVFTYNGKNAKSYKDGVLQDTKSFSESKTLDSFIGVIIGFSKAGGVWRSNKSYYSDFRVYCTALDQNDIKKLYNVNMSIDNFNNIHTFEANETGSRQLLLGIPFTSSYSYHSFQQNLYTKYNKKNQLYLDTNSTSIGSEYISINPTGKSYYYDIDYSINAGNQFYIGFHRYDIDKTVRSNNACVYVVAIKPTTDLVHQKARGIVNLSTDGVNACAFISLRILNGWSGTTSGVTGIATIHRLSLREISTEQNPKINTNGILLLDELNQNQNLHFYKNNIIEINQLIEK